MRISMRIPRMSREAFTRLEEATRPATGRLARYVELSRVGGFTETDAIEVDIKVEEAPRPHPTRNVVSLEMLGELFAIFGYFPYMGESLPTEIVNLVRIHIHNANGMIGTLVENEVGREDLRKKLLDEVNLIYQSEKKFLEYLRNR